jgi:hypothetical protein
MGSSATEALTSGSVWTAASALAARLRVPTALPAALDFLILVTGDSERDGEQRSLLSSTGCKLWDRERLISVGGSMFLVGGASKRVFTVTIAISST